MYLCKRINVKGQFKSIYDTIGWIGHIMRSESRFLHWVSSM